MRELTEKQKKATERLSSALNEMLNQFNYSEVIGVIEVCKQKIIEMMIEDVSTLYDKLNGKNN